MFGQFKEYARTPGYIMANIFKKKSTKNVNYYTSPSYSESTNTIKMIK